MSDENWSFDKPQENLSGTENGSSGEQGIVDSTAEVVRESAPEPAYTGPADNERTQTIHQTSGQYESYQAGNSYSNSEYAHADTGSATGNGSYQYSTSHEYYQGENYGSSVGSGSGGNSGGGRGKGFLAVILAVILGVCIGAGFWGVHRYVGSTSPAETQIAGSAENTDKVITGEKTEETPAQDPQQQQPAEEVTQTPQTEAPQTDPAQTPQTEAPQTEAPQTDPAQTPQTESPQTDPAAPADNSSMITDAEGVANEAGLIISDEVKPETELTKVVNKVMPSIVSVYNDYTQEVQNFFGETYTMEGQSTGSGIIIGKTADELLIVTNNHVVEGADDLSVMFIDQETCKAEIKGTDAGNDLAVIAVSLENIKDTTQNQIKIATLGNSDALKIGEDAIAIGNALGYGQSVTTGIVSAINREINDDTITGTFIQTDAAINPGNSGGALVDINGNVIGINSSKIGGATVEGMGFAIPISRAIPIIEELMSRETLTKVSEEEQGTIGISGVTVTSDVSKAYNMPVGVYVAQIIEGGGAAASDLQEGDIITALNGQSISGMEDLQKQLQYYKAGTEVTLTVQRQDGNGSYKEISVKVTLGTRASLQTEDARNGQGQEGSGRDSQGQSDRNDYDSQQNYDNGQQNGGYFDPFEFFFGR